MPPILDISSLADRTRAAQATAEGAALFYAFGNFCALAARPELESLRAMNALKGRPRDQVGSVTTTPELATRVFDWDAVRLPWSALVGVMADLHALGPIGFRGPAAAHIPAHLTVGGTVQLITPGDACPSNALVGEVLDLIGEPILSITSANANQDQTHYAIGEIRKEFGHHDDVVFIGHRNERANRRRYPHHRPCSSSIVGFDRGELVLERHGSLDADLIGRVATKHGLELVVAAHERLPVRRYRRPLSLSSAVSRSALIAGGRSSAR
jgi:tRNA A37 threonylcarbamoyladenosine synthetase subunit TsaC/SUA5/YrdC